MAEKLGVFGAVERRLAEAFWPGPLTLVVPRIHDCPVASIATAGLDTIAIRVPAHRAMRALLEATGAPLALLDGDELTARRTAAASSCTSTRPAADGPTSDARTATSKGGGGALRPR